MHTYNIDSLFLSNQSILESEIARKGAAVFNVLQATAKGSPL
jgi:hypothetical protein